MYKIQLIRSDGTVAAIYDQTQTNPLPVIGPKASLELNEAGSLSFVLLPGHSLYNELDPLSSYVRALDDGEEIFYGRVLQRSKPTLTGQVSYQCEGALTFLLDSEIEPDAKDRNGNQITRDLTAETFFRWCIDQHNADVDDPRRTFMVGVVNAEKKDRKDTYSINSYTQTKSAIESYILNIYGGFLRVRHAPFVDTIGQYGEGNIDLNNRIVVHNPDGSISTERSFSFNENDKEVLIPLIVNGQELSEDDAISHYRSSGEYLGKFDTVTEADVYAMKLHYRQDWYYNGRSNDPVLYIDWIEQYETLNPQAIQIGNNLEEQTNQFDSNQLFTVIRPVGDSGLTLTEKTIDLYSAADIEKYGRIVKTIDFKNATTEEELRTQAQEYVNKMHKTLFINSSIQYVDMHYLDGTSPKVRLGDRFSNLVGLEGIEMVAAGMELDFEHVENDTLDLKNPKSLSPDMTPEGNGHSGGRKLSRSHGKSSGLALKYYHELQDYAYIDVKKLEIRVDDLGIYVRDHFVETSHEFERISSRVDSIDGLTHTLSRQVGEVSYTVDSLNASAVIQNSDFISNVVGNFEVWTDSSGKKTVHLRNGAEMAVDDVNGGTITVGQIKTDQDQIASVVTAQGTVLESMEGSALWTQRDKITGVVGEYDIEYIRVEDPPGSGNYVTKKKLIVKSGGGMVIERDGVQYGLYDEGTLTGGLIVNKIDNETVTRINGTRIRIGESNTLTVEVTAEQLARFGLVDPSTGTLTGGLIVNKLNDGTVTSKISGDLIQIGNEDTTKVSISDLMTLIDRSVYIRRPLVVGTGSGQYGKVITLRPQEGRITAYESWLINPSSPGQHYALDYSTVGGIVQDIDIAGNNGTLTFTKFDNTSALTIRKDGENLIFTDKDGHTLTFSKAASIDYLTGTWSGGLFPLTIGTSPSSSHSYTIKFEDNPTGSSGSLSLCVTTNGVPTIQTADTLSVPIRVASQLTQPPYNKTTRYTKNLQVSVPLTAGETFTSNGTYAPNGTMGYRMVKVDVAATTVTPKLTPKWSKGIITVTSNPAAAANVSYTLLSNIDQWASSTTATSSKTRATVKINAAAGTVTTYTGHSFTVNADSVWNNGGATAGVSFQHGDPSSVTWVPSGVTPSLLAYDHMYRIYARYEKANGTAATGAGNSTYDQYRYWRTPVDRYDLEVFTPSGSNDNYGIDYSKEFKWPSDAEMYDPNKRMLDASTSPSGHTANYLISSIGSGSDGSGANVKFGFRIKCRNTYSKYYSFDGSVTNCYKDGYKKGYANGKASAPKYTAWGAYVESVTQSSDGNHYVLRVGTGWKTPFKVGSSPTIYTKD